MANEDETKTDNQNKNNDSDTTESKSGFNKNHKGEDYQSEQASPIDGDARIQIDKAKINVDGEKNQVHVGHEFKAPDAKDSMVGYENKQYKADTMYFLGEKNIGTNEPKEKIPLYTELAEEHSFVDARIPKLISDDIDRYYHALKRDNIILISCDDHDVSSAAVYAIIEQLKPECQSTRFLDFHKTDVDPKLLTINLFLTNKSISGTFEIIAINGIIDHSQTFIDSLFYEDLFRPSHIKSTLQRNKFFLICVLKSSYRRDKFKSKHDAPFELWDVPFWETRIHEFFPIEYQKFTKEILQQRARGLWSSNDSEFYSEFILYLRSKQLPNEIERRKNLENDENSATVFFENNKITTRSLFEDDDPIKKTVLYVAAYFPELSPADFLDIVCKLLGNKTKLVKTTTSYTTKKGKLKQIEQQEEKRLVEIWQKDPDNILQQCCLQTSQQSNLVRIITFMSPYLRKDVILYFEQRGIFLVNQFNNIIKLGLLFHSSENICDKVIDLAVEMALSYPEHYGKDWLAQMIISMTYQLQMEIDPNTSLEELFKQIWEKIELENLRRFVYFRITKLLRRLIVHDQLKNTAIGFLNQLLSWEHHRIVFDIVKHLRFIESFNMYFWLKRLIDESFDVRISVFQYLSQQANSFDPHSLFFLLKTINSWLPEKEREPKHYSPSNIYALGFLMNYSKYTIELLENDHYGQWPSQYPLFVDLDETSSRERFTFLFDWLFHNGINAIFEKNESYSIYSLITKWYLILHGFSKEPKDKKTSEHLNAFVETLISSTKNMGKEKEILNYLSNCLKSLSDIVSSRNELPLFEIERLNFEWIIIRQLTKKLLSQGNTK